MKKITKEDKLKKQQEMQKKDELEKLRKDILDLQQKIKEQNQINVKEKYKKNSKILLSICNFFAPFIISACLTTGVFKLFNGGFPFVKDDIIKYKKYSLDYYTNGYIELDEHYVTNTIFDEELPKNELIIYSPWQLNDGLYKRTIKTYDIGKIDSPELYEAVIKQDITHIHNTFSKYHEEEVVSNKINQDNNGFIIEARLNFLDKNDTLIYSESDLKNLLVTIAEVLVGNGFGVLLVLKRKFNLSNSIDKIKENYLNNSEIIDELKKELEEKENLVLTLRK